MHCHMSSTRGSDNESYRINLPHKCLTDGVPCLSLLEHDWRDQSCSRPKMIRHRSASLSRTHKRSSYETRFSSICERGREPEIQSAALSNHDLRCRGMCENS